MLAIEGEESEARRGREDESDWEELEEAGIACEKLGEKSSLVVGAHRDTGGVGKRYLGLALSHLNINIRADRTLAVTY